MPTSSLGTVLVTGGTGYIATHTIVELLENGYDVVALDNLSNSQEESLHRVRECISAKRTLAFCKADIRDVEALEQVFQRFKKDDGSPPFTSVIHFAGLKAVGQSVSTPLLYYENNVAGTCKLLQVMQRHNVRSIVFSSSATVYGDAAVPEGGFKEDQRTSATSPYGRSKLMIEEILRDMPTSEPGLWNIVLLRYFNPVGAHPSGLIGENPNGIPNNLMPYISQVASGKREMLSVYGGDYPTMDGTPVRDYIHVVDLSKGHISALQYIQAGKVKNGLATFNLGSGKGHSVLEVVAAMKRASGKDIPFKVVARRPGDVAESYASPDLAKEELGWVAERTLDHMCEDSWRWQSSNPNGYETKTTNSS